MARTQFPKVLDVSPQWEADGQIQLDETGFAAGRSTTGRPVSSGGFRWIVIPTSELSPTGMVDPSSSVPTGTAGQEMGLTYTTSRQSKRPAHTGSEPVESSVAPGQRAPWAGAELELTDGVLTVSGGCQDDLLLVTVWPADRPCRSTPWKRLVPSCSRLAGSPRAKS